MKLVLLYSLYFIGYAFITFDSGNELRYDYFYQAFDCRKNTNPSYTNTVTFSGTFQIALKIIISTYFYNIEYVPPSEFTFSITSITTTQFTTLITCPQVARFWGFRFTWIAIDDERVEVISVFNQNMTNIGSQTYTYSHSNINARQGFPTLISYGIGGPLNFKFDISSITADQVVVTLTQANPNFLSIGFQIVLGTPEAFTQYNLVTYSITPDIKYDTGVLTIPSGKKLILPQAGFNFIDDRNIRQTCDATETATTAQYQYYTCVKFLFTLGYFSFMDISLRQVFVSKSFTTTLVPMVLKKMRVSKLFDTQSASKLSMMLKVVEINLLLSTIGKQDYIIDKSIQTVNMVVSFKCSQGKKIQGQLSRCNSCNNQQFVVNQNCYNGINSVVHYIQFYQQDSVYQKINIEVTASGYIITQPVTNQRTSTSTLGYLEIVNI